MINFIVPLTKSTFNFKTKNLISKKISDMMPYCYVSGSNMTVHISDFTEEEVHSLKSAGAAPVGLGPCRLRVETATISLLSALMLWSDAKHQ